VTLKKLELTEVANKLVTLRLGEIPYNKIKKKEIWELLQVLMERPVLGLIDDGDEGSFQEELERVVNIYMSPDGVSIDSAISLIGGKLNYDTLLVFNQFIQHYLGSIAEAYDMLNTRPGELDHLSDNMKRIEKDIKDLPEGVKGVKIEVPFDLLVYMLNLISHMANDADLIMEIDDRGRKP